jgi:ribose transport system substrate-binding protein
VNSRPRHLAGLALASAALLATTGCSVSSSPSGDSGDSGSSKASGSSGSSDGTFTVGIAGANYAIEAARAQYESLAAVLEDNDIEVSFLDAQLDINTQVSQIDQFVDQGVDAIVVNLAGDPNAVAAPLARAAAAGIQLYSIGDTGSDDVLVQVDLPSEELGRDSAEYMCEQTGGTGTVALIEAIDIPVLALRWDTFLDTIASECPDLEVVATERAIPDDAATARPIAEDLLTRFPDLTAIWAMGDGPALGAGLAVDASGRDVVVTGLNGESQGIDGIKQGVVDATWDMLPTDIGSQLGERIVAILTGAEEAPTETDVFTVTDLPEWTADNVDEWVPYEDRVDYPGLA